MGALRLSVLFFLMAVAAPSAGQLLTCLVHPVEPPCCPSPCPIGDMSRLPNLSGAVTALQQMVALERQTVGAARQLQQTVGAAGALVDSAAAVIATAMRTVSDIPAGLAMAPALAMQSVKQSMFTDPGILISSSKTAALRQMRAAVSSGEQVAALALGMQHIAALPGVPANAAPAAASAGQSAALRSDSSSSSAARLAMLGDVAALGKLFAMAGSLTASSAAERYSETASPAAAPLVAGDPAPSVAPQQTASSLATATLPAMQTAAQSLLSSYSALQDTVAAAQLTQNLVAAAGKDLQASLQAVGLGGAGSLSSVQSLLRNLDASNWQDSGVKDQMSATAVAQVSAAILAGQPDSGNLQQAMAAWLAADKQSRYWQALAGSAVSSIAALDHRLGEISDGVGFDITSARP